MTLKRFNVVAGILRDSDGRILITERMGDSPFAGLWEFPGGKIADGESAEAALRRELSEEIGIRASGVEHFHHLEHRYEDRHIVLDFFLVRRWSGEPSGLEGQRLQWLQPLDIDDQLLLPADGPVLARLRIAGEFIENNQ